MESIKLKALAKINLGLDVIRKREDGYHDVRMIMQTIGLHDTVYIKKSSEEGVKIKTNLAFLPTGDNNLVYKAAQLLLNEFNIQSGLYIDLNKQIPVAAGLAGGSSDAAATLMGLNKLFELGLTKKQLMERGVKLGADVPYCILRGTALSEGIGDVLTPISPLPDCYIIIAKPDLYVSTKFVYENLNLDEQVEHPNIDILLDCIDKKDLEGVSNNLGNILETVTIKKYPIINDIKQFLLNHGAMNALMSGSGPTVFGIYNDYNQAMETTHLLQNSGLAADIHLTQTYNVKR